MSKYGDFIWWKEVIKYAKNNNFDVILVTDDFKEDWWGKNENGEHVLRDELCQDFKRTRQKINAYTSIQFFDLIKKEYKINEPDMVQYALELTDELYCERISDKVFEQISDELMYNGFDYLYEDTIHNSGIGLDAFDILSYKYGKGIQSAREDEEVYYVLEYDVEMAGYSYDYWGKDDESKEIILSPANYHEFKGAIKVSLKRKADIYIDFENEDSFEEPEIVEGYFEEIDYEPWN